MAFLGQILTDLLGLCPTTSKWSQLLFHRVVQIVPKSLISWIWSLVFTDKLYLTINRSISSWTFRSLKKETFSSFETWRKVTHRHGVISEKAWTLNYAAVETKNSSNLIIFRHSKLLWKLELLSSYIGIFRVTAVTCVKTNYTSELTKCVCLWRMYTHTHTHT